MAFPASAVMSEAATLIVDEGGHRWPPLELLTFLNAGIRDLLVLKPTAYSETTVIDLEQGTRQTLDTDKANLIRIVRNVANQGPPVIGGRSITMTDRDSLDAIGLDWHNPAIIPQSSLVMHAVADTADPRTFYVYPGNDGTGQIEVVAALVHAELQPPADPSVVENFTESVELEDLYRNALIDYVCYRAFQKDELVSGASGKSTMYFTQFANALGARQSAEMMANLNTAGQEPAARGG